MIAKPVNKFCSMYMFLNNFNESLAFVRVYCIDVFENIAFYHLGISILSNI